MYTPSRGIYEGPTKTRKIRAIRISATTLELLRKHKEAQQRLREKNGDRRIETEYVFTADNGNHMTPDSVTQWLAKFSETHNLPRIHPHAFRHTAASTMIASGIDPITTHTSWDTQTPPPPPLFTPTASPLHRPKPPRRDPVCSILSSPKKHSRSRSIDPLRLYKLF